MILALILHCFPPTYAGDVGLDAIEISANSDDAVTLARHALAAGRYEEAASAWGALAEAGGGSVARIAEAIAHYEGGSVNNARIAAEKALALAPGDVAALNVLGVALVDGGARDDGLKRLREALQKASGPWRARVLVNIALACADGGDAAGAKAAIAEATPLTAGQPALAAALEGAKVSLAALEGTDAGVGRALARGDLSGAKATAQKLASTATTPRTQVAASLAQASVDRAEGRLTQATRRLEEAVTAARAAGLAREVAIAQASLGIVHSIAGKAPLAIDAFRAAAEQARRGGYKVVEVDARTELGMALARLEDAAGAEAEQRAVGAVLGQIQYAAGVARQAELGGAIAGLRGDTATAETALSRAVAWYEGQSRFMDAARAGTLAVAAWEVSDTPRAQVWATRTEALFAKAGEPLGPAHVRMARGLAAARAHKTDVALEHFARAAQSARGVAGERAETVVRIAREDAARLLVEAGDDASAADRAAAGGLDALVTRERDVRGAFSAYDAGRTAYDARDWNGAKAKFEASRAAFERLGEAAYAQRAARASGWAQYNALVGMPTVKALDAWQQLAREVANLGDDELFLRTYAAAALATHKVGTADPAPRLTECARKAESEGYMEIAARCHGAIAERKGPLVERARHARTAFAFAPDEAAAVYALYAVAVDAVNEDDLPLARELARLARPRAAGLSPALDEVLRAAGE